MLFDLTRIRSRKTSRFSSWDKSGRNTDRWIVPARSSVVLADIQGQAQITHIWMTQVNHYRECLLKITYDDTAYPSVLAPLGDFFCLGHGMVNSFQSVLFSASTFFSYQFNKPCALNCYAPIPFARRAVVELVNESDEPHGNISTWITRRWRSFLLTWRTSTPSSGAQIHLVAGGRR